MKAIIICDDFPFTESAASTLARVGRRVGVNVQWITKCWSINALNEMELAESALADAIDAHLIVFPARRANALPAYVFDWLSRWEAVRSVADAAIGVIRFGNAATHTKLSLPELSTFAHEHGLSLIVDDDVPEKNLAGLSIRVRTESAMAFPVARTHLVGLAMQGSYRGFGINE